MAVRLGQTKTCDFPVHSPFTGQVSDADFLPICKVFEADTDIAILAPIVVKRTGETGNYRVTFIASAANGFEMGKSYNVDVEATKEGITAKARIASFNLEAENAVAARFQV